MKRKKFAVDSRQLSIAAGVVFGLIVVIALVVQFGPSSVTGNNKQESQANDTEATKQEVPNPAVTDPGNQQTKPSAATTVNITASGFSPNTMTIARGTTITWYNADSTSHAVDAVGDGVGIHSPELRPKASFNYSFQKTGSFNYTDALNPKYTGTIKVVEVDNKQ